MKKMTIKLDRTELNTVISIVKNVVESLEHKNNAWSIRVLRSVLKDVILITLLKRLLIPKKIYTITVKEFEAECLNVAMIEYEIETSNPYCIALIQKIKNTPII